MARCLNCGDTYPASAHNDAHDPLKYCDRACEIEAVCPDSDDPIADGCEEPSHEDDDDD